MNRFEIFLRKYKFIAPLFLRLVFGYHLIQYTYGDVFKGTAGSGNSEWLGSKGVPLPYLMGWVYILTEFLGGIALIFGFKIRYFALLLAINFIIALALVHIGDTYKNSFDAIHMLAISIFFLFNGAGSVSIDNYAASRKNN
ncbi:MAG TPA: DoxX family protein [Flavobacterium sp.]|nr:DoxX family protein [Flavobacterium sp.]